MVDRRGSGNPLESTVKADSGIQDIRSLLVFFGLRGRSFAPGIVVPAANRRKRGGAVAPGVVHRPPTSRTWRHTYSPLCVSLKVACPAQILPALFLVRSDSVPRTVRPWTRPEMIALAF